MAPVVSRSSKEVFTAQDRHGPAASQPQLSLIRSSIGDIPVLKNGPTAVPSNTLPFRVLSLSPHALLAGYYFNVSIPRKGSLTPP